MKIKTQVLLSAILCTSLTSFGPTANASESLVSLQPEHIYELSTNVPNDNSNGISIQGAYPPNSSSSSYNLNQSVYYYNVTEVGSRIYTDKLLTGASSMKVSVSNWTVLQASAGTQTNKLTIRVRESNGQTVGTQTIDPFTPPGTNAVVFNGLSSSKKYYVEFDVNSATYDNRYSFNGSILRLN